MHIYTSRSRIQILLSSHGLESSYSHIRNRSEEHDIAGQFADITRT